MRSTRSDNEAPTLGRGVATLMNMIGVRSRLDGVMGTESEDALWQRANMAKELGRPDALRDLIGAILGDPIQLEQVASRSYVHANGFDKLVLLGSCAPIYKLRLHIWWPGRSEPELDNVHNHRWDFSSSVVTGTVRS